MNTHQQTVVRDERTVAVENVGYRWAYTLITYALLVDVMYRGLIRNEAAWDLLALIIAGGVLCAAHQARQNALPQGWIMHAVLIACLAAAAAFLVAFVM